MILDSLGYKAYVNARVTEDFNKSGRQATEEDVKLGEKTHRYQYLSDFIETLSNEAINTFAKTLFNKYFGVLPEVAMKIPPGVEGNAFNKEDGSIRPAEDFSQSASKNGGIDLNGKKMGLDVVRDDKGVEMKIDPAMIAEFQKGDFTGVEGVILKITPFS